MLEQPELHLRSARSRSPSAAAPPASSASAAAIAALLGAVDDPEPEHDGSGWMCVRVVRRPARLRKSAPATTLIGVHAARP